MAVPNEGTTTLPSDANSSYFWGLWDALNSVFRAWRGDANGAAYVVRTGYSSVGDGRKTVAAAATAEAFSSQACKAVLITAETNNTGIVVIGGSTVVAALGTRRGTPLSAGDSVIMEVTNMNLLYLDVTVSGDGVTFTYFA